MRAVTQRSRGVSPVCSFSTPREAPGPNLAAATTMTIEKAARPKHYLAYGFLGPLCADCYELAEFIHVCTTEEKPTGWVRSTLAEEEATRVADATALTVDVAKQRRALIV